METKKCPNCNNEMSVKENICPFCGTKMNDGVKPAEKKFDINDSNTKKGLLVLALAILGLFIIFVYRAWLGTPIYIIGAIIAILHLKEEHEAFGGTLTEFLKDCLKEGDFGTKVMAIVAILLPIVAIFGIIRYINVDTERQIESIYNSYF